MRETTVARERRNISRNNIGNTAVSQSNDIYSTPRVLISAFRHGANFLLAVCWHPYIDVATSHVDVVRCTLILPGPFTIDN